MRDKSVCFPRFGRGVSHATPRKARNVTDACLACVATTQLNLKFLTGQIELTPVGLSLKQILFQLHISRST
jgi:hypothetical protein